MAIIAIAVRDRSSSGTDNSYIRLLESVPQSLAEILNKSSESLFSFVNVAGRRIAATDEMGNRYFYVYDAQNQVAIIVDQNDSAIWRAINHVDQASK